MSSDWILVTGANGFLGARLVRQLVEKGEKVKAFVRAGANLDQLKDLPSDQVRIATGDVRIEYAALRSCDRMYHVAATFSFDESRRADVLADSIVGTKATLEAARRAGLKKIVVTSSIATLGTGSKDELLDESSEFGIQDPTSYSEAKHGAEAVALQAAKDGLPVVIVNPATILGPGDWKPTPTGAQIVEYLGMSPSFRVPTLPGGLAVVDVDDVASGHIAAMERGKVGERYILGGENLSYSDLYSLMSDISGLAEPGKELSRGMANLMATGMELVAAWTGRPPLLTRKMIENYYGEFIFVSSAKAKADLGYEPRSARDALARSCKWFLENGYVSKRAARRARLELRSA